MIRKFKKLKMKQQALILQGSIILLVLLFVSIFIVPISSHGLKIIKKSSHEALIRSNDARVSLMSDKISTLISQAFLQANLTLNKAQQLYLTSINSSYNITSSYKKKVEKGYLLAYQQPYNMEQIDPTSDYCQKFGNLIQLIDSYLLSFSLEQSSNIQIIYRIQQPHLTSIFSPITLFSTYDVEQKSYYTEHLLQNNTRIIGSPFISSTTSKVSFMITQTLHNQQNSKEMIMAIGFQFDNLSQYLTLNNIKFVLCTVTGIIVSSNINTSKVQAFKELTLIYNQTIFPFNQDDWDQMNRYLYHQEYESNCRQSFIKFCRNLDGNDIQLEPSLVQTKFIQIIYNDLSFTIQEQNFLQENIQELLLIVSKYGGLILFQCLLILIISTIIITKIIKPIADMINVVELEIQTSSLDDVEYSECNQQPSNIITELQKSFINFIQRHIYYRYQKVNKFNKQHYPKFNQYIQLNKQGTQLINNQSLYFNPRTSSYRYKNKLKKQEISNKFILEKIEQIISKL